MKLHFLKVGVQPFGSQVTYSGPKIALTFCIYPPGGLFCGGLEGTGDYQGELGSPLFGKEEFRIPP